MAQTTRKENFSDGREPGAGHKAVLSADRYTDAGIMAREWDGIWTRAWLFAGLESDLEEAGDYFVFEVGRESIVVLRQESDDILAFYNVCQHRGNRIFTNESGAVGQISCPYHGWTYELDGSLVTVPDAERFEPSVVSCERSLKPVRVALWAGMVWVNMDPQADSLENFLGDIIQHLNPYRFQDMRLVAHQTVSIAANWKTARDNFLEQYHVDFIHPQHASLVDCCNSINTLWPLGHSSTVVEGYTTDSRYPLPKEVPPHLIPLLKGLNLAPEGFDGRVESIREAVQQQKRLLGEELGFDYSGLNDAQLSDVWQYDIFPNLFMTIQAEELWLFGPRPHPTDPDSCYFDKWTLQIPKEQGTNTARRLTLNPRLADFDQGERPKHEVFTQEEVIAGKHSMTITIDQDIYYLGDMQAGMHSRGFDHAVLNVDEARVQHFHDWVDQWLREHNA